MAANQNDEPLLEIKNLSVGFNGAHKGKPVVCGVSMKVHPGEILGLVGESGSGKSVTCYSVVRLLGERGWTEGEVLFDNKDTLSCPESDIVAIRGREIAMIFQDAQSFLNPVQTVGSQLMEALMLKKDLEKRSSNIFRKEAVKLLTEVGIPDPERRMGEYPHQLSGGQNQRVMIAIMLAGDPRLLIADEPTTALDVTIQAQILRLLKKLCKERNMAIILVTHDLGVIAETCERTVVMYGGKVMECGPVEDVLVNPKHPYTLGLLSSKPRIDKKVEKLNTIEGVVPSPENFPEGCPFYDRCINVTDKCKDISPPIVTEGMRHYFCFNPVKEGMVWK
ncbi:MAG: peptide ABC transporter ATP-binding protein [Bacteroidetes bacterium]|nr:MAG: peptide ABC transporter ATP-binding protein [Bacteroidota bacterium]